MNRESRMPAPRDRRHAITMAAFAAAALALAGCSEPAQHSTRLPALPIDPASVTVSGLASGAAMATQLHVAHSGLIHGAALVAGMPYQCSGGTIRHSLGRCMKADEPIPTPRLIELTSRLALEGFIDPIADLADDRVWIFHGALDPYVRKPVADAVQAYYEALVNPANVTRVELEQAGHTFPTERTDASACDVTEPPFVGSCGYDGAAALLEHLYGSLSPGRAPHEGELVEFDQRPYARAAGSEGLAAKGLLFVPDACRAGGDRNCRLHIVFHGCKQGVPAIGHAFVLGSGYLEVAAANDVVLLLPQVEASYQPLNPMGCWDWWGYEGEDYATQRGAQVAAVRAMVADLLGETRQ